MKQILLSICAVVLFINESHAQVPTCGQNVPYFQVNLTGQPAGIWISPGHERDGNCCNTIAPDRCTSFEVILDPNAAMVNFTIASGAIPPGSMFYQVNCGPQVPVGQPICVTGVGPHFITFCKPGNNQNTYQITSIPRPTFPVDASVRIGCNQNLTLLGMDTNSVTWNSIFPGTPGQYNSYLSCTSNCTNPVYTPAPNAPPYIDYYICGLPIADECGFVYVCDTIRIYNIPSLSGNVTPTFAAFCANGPGVLLTANGTGGDGNYSYIWRDPLNNTVGTNSTYLASSAGTFTVEIRDGLNSTNTCPPVLLSIPVTVTPPPIVNAGPDQTLCATSPTANLTGTVQYATGGIWSGGTGTFNPSNTSLFTSYTPTSGEILSGGVTLILTSTGAGGGCTNSTDTIQISYPPALTLSIPPQTLACYNSTTVITPLSSGGVFPYTYQWNNGATTSSITAGQGNYCVTITDMIGCTAVSCINVVAPPSLSLSLNSTNVTVPSGSDGTATASPSGGTSPYTYLWSNGQTTQTATGLAYGIYSVTITDANGCTISSSAVVNEPFCSAFQANVSSVGNLCYGNTGGTSTVTVTGGNPPFTYLWNDPQNQTTQTATGLAAGTYLVIVTDNNGCMDAVATVITQPSQLVNNMNHANATTVGGNEGSATSNPLGGTPAYSYQWSNGATTSSISNLVSGTYYLTITDANGCTQMDSVFINQPPCNNLSLGVYFTPVTCFGGSDANASAVAAFGTLPYTYLWSNGGTTQSISNLSAGNYAVTVTDAVGCVQFQSINVTQPGLLSLVLTPANVICASMANGTIELTISGGTFPYTFNWSNSTIVEDQYNLGIGTYSVVVTDINGCTATGSTSIGQPSPLSISYTKTDVTCNAGNDGSIDVTVIGGVTPYTYSWSSGATTEDIAGLTSGQYFLTVTDANGCNNSTVPLSVLIDEPDPVSISSVATNCPVPSSGVSYVVVTGGGGNGGPYEVSYDNGNTYNAQGDYDEFLPAGNTYSIVVKDSLGCVSQVTTVTINPEVIASNISFATCFSSPTTATLVTVTPTGGDGGPYEISFDNGNTFNPAGNYSQNLPIDSAYTIIVRDPSGCVSAIYNIIIPDTFNLTTTVSLYTGGNNVTCFGATDGNIDLNVAGGTSPYTYLWNNGSTTQDITNLAAGNYSVVITDNNGCTQTASLILTEPVILDVIITSTSDTICAGASTTLSSVSTGGTNPYAFSWLPSGSGSSITVNPTVTSTYTVISTDINGCTASYTTPIVVNALPAVSFTSTTPGGCGSVCVNFSNTTPGSANCQWNFTTGAANTCDTVFCFNTVGTYDVSLTVTDNNGCVNTGNSPSYVTVYAYPTAAFTADPDTITLSNANICFTDLSTGATAWSWIFGDTLNSTSNLANPCFTYFDTGWYQVQLIVQNAYGCEDTVYQMVLITPDPVSAKEDDLALPDGYSPNGDGYNDFFEIKGLNRYPENTIIVFNRWGNEVYSQDNYTNTWNGQNNKGDALPDGTYFIVFTIKSIDFEYNGFVDIRR